MSEQPNGFFRSHMQSGTQALDLVARLFDVADPGAVYAPPLVTGDRTVILAAELSASVGAGYGGGPDSGDDEGGGGGGGGGFAAARPVAAVVIEPGGVRIEPVVDVTKLGIALLTTLAALFLAWARLRRDLKKLT